MMNVEVGIPFTFIGLVYLFFILKWSLVRLSFQTFFLSPGNPGWLHTGSLS
jgi:hypothetical protein